VGQQQGEDVGQEGGGWEARRMGPEDVASVGQTNGHGRTGETASGRGNYVGQRKGCRAAGQEEMGQEQSANVGKVMPCEPSYQHSTHVTHGSILAVYHAVYTHLRTEVYNHV